MSREPRWLSKKALLFLHEERLAAFGGSSGLRDEELLDSALARPRNRLVDAPESTLTQLAASYCFGLVNNHAFVDGNKRIGFLSIGVFLSINGYKLVVDQVEAIQMIINVVSGAINEEQLAEWMVQNLIPQNS